MKAIYEESSESYATGPEGVSVTVLKAEVTDAARTPRYLVVLSTFTGVGSGLTQRWDRHDANVIRLAQAQFDTLKAKIADDS